MLTMKHIFNGHEFAREIGSYTCRRGTGLLTFSVSDDSGLGDSEGMWGGHEEYYDGAICGNIYVMNSAGATIANFRYYCDADTIVGDGLTLPDLPADMLEAA